MFAAQGEGQQVGPELLGDALLLERVAEEVPNLMRRESRPCEGRTQLVVEAIAQKAARGG